MIRSPSHVYVYVYMWTRLPQYPGAHLAATCVDMTHTTIHSCAPRPYPRTRTQTDTETDSDTASISTEEWHLILLNSSRNVASVRVSKPP